ncbi:glycosyltransferase [Brytella acorum]|uniref:Glycosyltransferase n=2 Tax=Brytella acorum TaxID=2959299 RepID=A0AA35VFF7_9PROT|nr:glycosyltransferase [Brytella acorum]CAI9122211.1 glycosyltransferase [Brytella acorum]
MPQADIPSAETPLWSRFDAGWYLRAYPEVAVAAGGTDAAVIEAYYLETGRLNGHSPNAYFDEEWYRQKYPAVYKSICAGSFESGFVHYQSEGYVDHSPHWLFDEIHYRRTYPAVSQSILAAAGLANGYDHFLTIGQDAFLSGHPFYDPECATLLLRRLNIGVEGQNVFGIYLGLDSVHSDQGRVSWFFDPVWYLARYPHVAREITAGRYRSALHHYLTNDTPRAFDPQEWFSESDYLTLHPDLGPSLEHGHFRNACAHFVTFGAKERRAPRQGLDLKGYAAHPLVAADLRMASEQTAFTHWVRAKTEGPRLDVSVTRPNEEQTRERFVRDACALVPAFMHRPLDFSFVGVPDVSVIVVVHDQIALTMQTLASLRSTYRGAIELIVVDSGSTDLTRHIERMVRGAQMLRFRTNIGFLDGANAGLNHAQAPYVLYLNNDVRLYPMALANAIRRMNACSRTGAVGAKLVRTNMALQEAGSIIWRDGATYGYRREDDPNIAEANFTRDVDYSSAAFLLVRKDLLKRLGGFDPRYRPAYFEDTDLCLRIVEAGFRIVYDPSVVVEHLEFGSSGTARSQAMIKANHRLFGETHKTFLRRQLPAHVRNAILGREARDQRRRVLYLEDRVPLPRLGSGYVRSFDVVGAMSALGYQVTVFPVSRYEVAAADRFGVFPDDVELMWDASLADLPAFLEERAGYYDLVWVGRTHNMARLAPYLNEAGRYLPSGGAILDTEVVATPRNFERARVLGLPLPEDFDKALVEELEPARDSQAIVAVTDHDATLIRRAGYGHVRVLGHALRPRSVTQDLADRKNFLIVGAIHDRDSPNYDALHWLVHDVLPHLDALLPPDVAITVAGFVAKDVDMSIFGHASRIRYVGPQHDLTALYDTHRVFVAPTRFAGGLPFKVHEAAANGLPIVTTELIARQVGWRDEEALLAASSDDPEGFARQMALLYCDELLWDRVKTNALIAVTRDADPGVFRERLDDILKASVVS